MDPKSTNMEAPAPWTRALIGKRVRHRGEIYEILEILSGAPAMLVLQNESHTTIQPDQHGEAHRRVPETVTVPVTLSDSGELDFDDMEIELLRGSVEAEPAG